VAEAAQPIPVARAAVARSFQQHRWLAPKAPEVLGFATEPDLRRGSA
jgi:hypothetical protein